MVPVDLVPVPAVIRNDDPRLADLRLADFDELIARTGLADLGELLNLADLADLLGPKIALVGRMTATPPTHLVNIQLPRLRSNGGARRMPTQLGAARAEPVIGLIRHLELGDFGLGRNAGGSGVDGVLVGIEAHLFATGGGTGG